MAREFVLNPYPGGIEHTITQLCQRRKAILARLADEELNGLLSGPDR
ncbi:MAG TPA: hypothetical protein VM782_20860 [Stellaceae bacterium]|nr:hypothetical protein [Stellaceae bacterium]